MANDEHVAMLNKGVDAWNAWRDGLWNAWRDGRLAKAGGGQGGADSSDLVLYDGLDPRARAGLLCLERLACSCDAACDAVTRKRWRRLSRVSRRKNQSFH
jgi:hypothetical protein